MNEFEAIESKGKEVNFACFPELQVGKNLSPVGRGCAPSTEALKCLCKKNLPSSSYCEVTLDRYMLLLSTQLFGQCNHSLHTAELFLNADTCSKIRHLLLKLVHQHLGAGNLK